jgi:hypothetical protein
MRPIPFPQQTCVFAKDQPEYLPQPDSFDRCPFCGKRECRGHYPNRRERRDDGSHRVGVITAARAQSQVVRPWRLSEPYAKKQRQPADGCATAQSPPPSRRAPDFTFDERSIEFVDPNAPGNVVIRNPLTGEERVIVPRGPTVETDLEPTGDPS